MYCFWYNTNYLYIYIYILGVLIFFSTSPQFLYANIASKIDSVPPVVNIPIASLSYPNKPPVILITSASI